MAHPRRTLIKKTPDNLTDPPPPPKSVFSNSNSGLGSILKVYSNSEREKAKTQILNKVRFEVPKEQGLREAVHAVTKRNNFEQLSQYIDFLRETEMNDDEFLHVLAEARSVVNELSPKFTNLVMTLVTLPWIKRSPECVQVFSDFCVDLAVVHTHHVELFLHQLVSLWKPADTDAAFWPNGVPASSVHNELQAVHKTLHRILTAIPMSYDALLRTVGKAFPYYKKAPHVVAGFLHNVLWLLEYKPQLMEHMLEMVFDKMISLDVNAPRREIEETEGDNEDDDDDEMEEQEEHIFEMDDCNKEPAEVVPMQHPIAQTLDLCMEKICAFFEMKNTIGVNLSEDQKLAKQTEVTQFLKVLLRVFDRVILPSHNTHHAQFLLFYFCSFKSTYAEAFLSSLWEKIRNPNVSAVIRQAAVGYVASFLARSKFLSINILKHYIKELCTWAHQYIQSADQYRTNGSLKANLVFYSICQAIFYVIAFRSRVLTADKKNLLFLQSQHLSGLVTCHLNPLRVCLPAVATAFAGVTRAYQLAYCHAILERNARRKLATVYANVVATPEETLDTFFPFDPYLLKISGPRIDAHYLQYQASDAEEHAAAVSSVATNDSVRRRKRGDSEMLDDHDVDAFLIADKRQKFLDLARSQERDEQFTYGLSPGFHM